MKLSAILTLAGLLAAPAIALGQQLSAQEAGMSFFTFAPAKASQLSVASVSANPWASDMARAQAAYRKGDFVAARESLEKASAQGNIIATWYLGHLYRLGRGVAADSAMAFKLYSAVLESFSPDEPDRQRLKVMIDSMVRVADTYRKGDGRANIAPDPGRAYGMYNTAASFGHPAAHYALGVMTLNGDGVRRNPELGLKWLMLSARKRFPLAEAALGELYFHGGVVQADRVRALMWYNLARQTAAPSVYPDIFVRAEAIEAQMTETERADAVLRAKQWAEKYPAAVASSTTASLTGE